MGTVISSLLRSFRNNNFHSIHKHLQSYQRVSGALAYHFGKTRDDVSVETCKNHRSVLDGIIYMVKHIALYMKRNKRLKKSAPAFLSNFFRDASVDTTIIEPNHAYRPVISASPPDTVISPQIRGPIPIEKPASMMQLPMASPMAISNCLFLMAIKSTINSGREVPIATMKKLMKYSDTCRIADKAITDSITMKDPKATPRKPRRAAKMCKNNL